MGKATTCKSTVREGCDRLGSGTEVSVAGIEVLWGGVKEVELRDS